MVQGKRRLHITGLQSGGLITNYFCTSRCRHCLYACGPRWKKHFVDEKTAAGNLEAMRGLGCRAIHIGGGEPLLNPKALLNIIDLARCRGIHIDYVETNSSWYRDQETACRLLTALKQQGVSTLLVSISPFHNEYIPFKQVKGVMEACRRTGVSVFPWSADFYPEIDSFDDRLSHPLEAYEQRFGPHYLGNIPSRYWIHLGGRALYTFARLLPMTPVAIILEQNRGGCDELADVSHFHFDPFGHYLPGLCSGLAISQRDLPEPLPARHYPLITRLYSEGIAALLDTAIADHNFEPQDRYLNKCHLCTEIRLFLVMERKISSPELQPSEFYQNLWRYRQSLAATAAVNG